MVTAPIWLFRMSPEWFCRSNQLQSMANSNLAVLRTPSECRLVELCCVCVFTLAKLLCAIYICNSTCSRTYKQLESFLSNDCNCKYRSASADRFHKTRSRMQSETMNGRSHLWYIAALSVLWSSDSLLPGMFFVFFFFFIKQISYKRHPILTVVRF